MDTHATGTSQSRSGLQTGSALFLLALLAAQLIVALPEMTATSDEDIERVAAAVKNAVE